MFQTILSKLPEYYLIGSSWLWEEIDQVSAGINTLLMLIRDIWRAQTRHKAVCP